MGAQSGNMSLRRPIAFVGSSTLAYRVHLLLARSPGWASSHWNWCLTAPVSATEEDRPLVLSYALGMTAAIAGAELLFRSLSRDAVAGASLAERFLIARAVVAVVCAAAGLALRSRMREAYARREYDEGRVRPWHYVRPNTGRGELVSRVQPCALLRTN